LVVGDATVHADVGRLMAGEAADLVFSDLPYNCAYEGYTQDKLNIQNDDMSPEQFARFLRDSFVSFRTVVKPGASLYICHSSAFQREFQNALEGAGFEVRCQIVWAKNTFAWGSGR
jgi:DNA modification methylase